MCDSVRLLFFFFLLTYLLPTDQVITGKTRPVRSSCVRGRGTETYLLTYVKPKVTIARNAITSSNSECNSRTAAPHSTAAAHTLLTGGRPASPLLTLQAPQESTLNPLSPVPSSPAGPFCRAPRDPPSPPRSQGPPRQRRSQRGGSARATGGWGGGEWFPRPAPIQRHRAPI